jgi:hypothetical protein
MTMDRESLTHEMIELHLYAKHNVGKAYYEPSCKTLGKFHKDGTFNLDRAIAYLDRYCLMPAAKQYLLEFGSMADSIKNMFPRSERLKLAEYMAIEMVGEFKIGNY